ncbi:MAG TPA: tetratricopeptide repeat protein [Polyangiaceae bacterium]|nr:tetratricopeptide repeat protein [Polyangiaceae bacterium]
MSETKETESGAEAQADSSNEGESTPPEATEEAAGEETSAEGEGSEATVSEAAEGSATPKKKKKKAREASESETIRDRNARVRAEAAEKRRARREREQGNAPRRNLDASEVVDDALARSTHAAAGFLTKHFNKVQWVIMAGLAGWISWEVYSWRHARTTEKATDALFKALAAEMGKVGSSSASDDERGGPEDTRRSFATEEERLKAAKSEYLLASAASGSKSSVLSELGAAGIAYDLGQYKEAQAAYEKVKQHPAYATDTDIKGRTLDGLGMALEAQKQDEAALKVFHELANMDSANFAALGMYQQARMLKAEGKTEDALKLLDKAGDKLATLKETPGAIKYVGSQVVELLETIDPKKARELTDKLMSSEAKEQMGQGPGGASASKVSAELQKRIQEMMAKQKSQPAPMPGPVAPAPEAPAPTDAPVGEAPTDAPAPASSGAQ